MKTITILILGLILFEMINAQHKKLNPLTEQEAAVIIKKGTERPFTGKFYDFYETGTYTCKQCDAPLYKSTAKFDSSCGWPSFDDEVNGAVKRVPDADGRRTEIVCANCGAHLGHVFLGEGFTEKNTRHCVNSISLNFIADKKNKQMKTETAYFASGCFWGVEYHFSKADGVKSTTVGYSGGTVKNPTYKQVCTGLTGHAETIEVEFDPSKVSYETLAKLFFETHDQGQEDGQGPDIGNQYRSEIFYTSEEQKETAEKLMSELKSKGFKVATKLTPFDTFYEAENYHQDYYDNNGKMPYCHAFKKKF